MKALLIAITFLFCGIASAQYLPVTPSAYGANNNRIAAQTAIMLPTGCGKPGFMSLYSVDSMHFAIKGDSCNNKIYFYNPKTRVWSFLSDSTISVGDLPIDRRDYQNSTPIFNITGKKVIFFGNSIQSGSGASGTPPSPNRYSTILCRLLNAIEINLAVSGMFMTKQPPLSSMGSKFAVDSMTYIPAWDTSIAMLVIGLGVNDLLFNGLYYTPANYKAAADTIISYFVNTKGYPRERILIEAPSFVSYTGRAHAATIYNTYPTWQGMASAQRENDYVQAAADVSKKWGTLYANMNKIFTIGGDSLWLVYGEGIHPNDTGHYMMAQYAYGIITGNTWQVTSLLVNGILKVDSGIIMKPITSIPVPGPLGFLGYVTNAPGTVRAGARSVVIRGISYLLQNEAGITNFILNDTGLALGNTSQLATVAARKRLDVRNSAVIDDTLQVGKIPALGTTPTKVLVWHTDSTFRWVDPADIVTAGGGTGVSTVSVVTANGISGTVANPTTTPAITLQLGNITPASVVTSGAITGTTIGGTLATAAQPNITSVGTLTNLDVLSTVNVRGNGSNTAFSGPYSGISNLANSITWGWTLNGSNGYRLIQYPTNGTYADVSTTGWTLPALTVTGQVHAQTLETQAGAFSSGATIDNTAQFWTNTNAGSITVTLPTAVGHNKIYTIRYGASAGGGNTLTVGTTSSQNIIDHTTTATTYVMAAGQVIGVQSDGSSWIIIWKN